MKIVNDQLKNENEKQKSEIAKQIALNEEYEDDDESNQDSVKIKVLEADYKKVVAENNDLRQMIDEYGEKSLHENRKIKMLEEEAKSTKEKLELQLLDQNIMNIIL